MLVAAGLFALFGAVARSRCVLFQQKCTFVARAGHRGRGRGLGALTLRSLASLPGPRVCAGLVKYSVVVAAVARAVDYGIDHGRI